MGRLINALLGAFGFVRYKKKWDEKATFAKFVASCYRALRPGENLVSFILVSDISPEFMSAGISGATGSGWQHALTCLHDGGDFILADEEIVESQTLVEVGRLSKYDRNDIQAVAFSISLDDDNFTRLKNRLYSQIGKPYDVAEFLSYLKGVFEIIPNSKDLHVCSTLTTFGTKGIFHRWFGRYKELRLIPEGLKPHACVPGDIWDGCITQPRFRVSKYHFK